MSLSTTKAKYVAAIAITCEEVLMRRILRDLCYEQEGTTNIFCNNNSVIKLSKNYAFYKGTKHIDTKYHFIRELINNGEIVLQQ